MTEVWEEKSKSGSEDVKEHSNERSGNDKDSVNAISNEKAEEKATCPLCRRVFKNFRALKTHERYCKGEKKNTESANIGALKRELSAEMEAIKEERKKLKQERGAFKEEMRRELEEIKGAGPKKTRTMEPPSYAGAEAVVYKEPETQTAPGVVVLEAEEEASSPEEEIEEIEHELEEIEPEVRMIGRGISRSELEELSKDLETVESELNMKVDFEALAKMSEEYNKSMERIEESISALNRKIDGMKEEMEESGRKYGTYQNIVREMKRMDDKTTQILEEIGFGESLNVAKIPPNILESVYESTMEDIIEEIRRNYGSQDAEKIITRTLEEIRMRTSGSELFFYDGRMLKTRNLAKVIKNRLISAKQVQTTYGELLGKLLEYLPGYKAKNFRAMIKLKSQEYAVDKTTFLLESFNSLKEEIGTLKTMVANISNRHNSLELGINNLMRSKVERKDVEEIQGLMEEIKVKQNDLESELNGIKERIEEDKSVFSQKIELISSKMEGQKEEKKEIPKSPKKKAGKEADKKKGSKEPELNEEEQRILTMIPGKGFTLTRIKKELCQEMGEEKIQECVESLMNKGAMSTMKRGRHTIYIKSKEKGNNGGEK